jgi:adenosylcobinamide-GDP ribazoletransferase
MNLASEIRLFLTSAEFLTRLPVPGLADIERPRLARTAKYFPLVGLLVGAISAAAWLLASGLPPSVAAGLAIGAGLLATGALHEDGLADCCDGLGGGATRERALEIMRDSRIGAYGAAGLIFSIGLRWAALASFDPWAGAAALLIAHSTGRAMMAAALALAGYARTDGLATSAAGVNSREALIALALAFGAALVFGLGAGALAFLAGALAAAVMLWRLVRRLGGYTGDGLGAIEQVAEIAALIVLAGAWA